MSLRVLLTGASSGIGAAAAVRFAREGARLGLLARRRERLEDVAARVREAGGEAIVLVEDVAAPGAAERAVAAMEEAFGGVDVLVNNAGFGLYGPVAALRDEDVRRLFEVNVFAPVRFVRATLDGMLRQGRGHIVNVSSIVGKRALPMTGAYAATKFALEALSDALRLELDGTGVVVTVVRPGYTETEFSAATIAHGRVRRPPRGRAMSAEEVADVLWRVVRRPRRDVALTARGRLLLALERLSPALTDGLLRRYLGQAAAASRATTVRGEEEKEAEE